MDEITVVHAIKNGEVLSILYGGGLRLVEPFTFGRLKSGKLMLRVYQISGFSRSGEPTGWKLLAFAEIISGVPTGSTFSGPRPGYNPNDSVMRGGIIATF